MKKGGELTESVGRATLYVMKVHRNVIHQEITLAVMKKSNRVETQETFVSAQNALITERKLKQSVARFLRSEDFSKTFVSIKRSKSITNVSIPV